MIEVLVGVIASGKSTYARNRADEGAIAVNADAVVTMLQEGKYHGYDKALKPLYKALEIEMAIAAILAGRDVVIDNTNTTRATRARWLGLAKAMGVKAVARYRFKHYHFDGGELFAYNFNARLPEICRAETGLNVPMPHGYMNFGWAEGDNGEMEFSARLSAELCVMRVRR